MRECPPPSPPANPTLPAVRWAVWSLLPSGAVHDDALPTPNTSAPIWLSFPGSFLHAWTPPGRCPPLPARYLTGRTTGGVWLCFFLLQAPLVMGERAALAALKRQGIRLPAWLRRAATILLLVAAGQLLFWPPAMEHGVVSSLVANTQAGILRLAEAVRGALRMT